MQLSKLHHKISVKTPPEENPQFENHRKISFTEQTSVSSVADMPVSSEVVLPHANVSSDDQKIEDEQPGDASSITASNESNELQDETDCTESVDSSSNGVRDLEGGNAHEVPVANIKQGSECIDNPDEGKVSITDIDDTNISEEIEKGIEAIYTADNVQSEENVEADCIVDNDDGKTVNSTADCSELKETYLGDTKENQKEKTEDDISEEDNSKDKRINKDGDDPNRLADSVTVSDDQTSESKEVSLNAESNAELSDGAENVSGVDEAVFNASKSDESVNVNVEKMQDDVVNTDTQRFIIPFFTRLYQLKVENLYNMNENPVFLALDLNSCQNKELFVIKFNLKKGE